MAKKNRVLAVLLAVAVTFVMLFSAVFFVAQADHDCTSEDCPICYQISVCENTLKQLSLVVIAACISAALTYTWIRALYVLDLSHARTTLITLKVKLSN